MKGEPSVSDFEGRQDNHQFRLVHEACRVRERDPALFAQAGLRILVDLWFDPQPKHRNPDTLYPSAVEAANPSARPSDGSRET